MATKRKLNQEKKYSYVLNHIQSYAREKKICFMIYDHPKMICLSDGKHIVRIDEYLQVEGHVKLCAEIAEQTGDSLVFEVLDLILPGIIGNFKIPRVYLGKECLVAYIGDEELKHVPKSLEEITTAQAIELTGIQFTF